MSGGVSDVFVDNITCVTAGWGLNVKSALGRGGYVTNVTYQNVVQGPGSIGVALAAGDTYRDRFPAAPVNATLVPVMDGVYVTNVTYAGPQGGVKRAGDFEGLGGAGNVTRLVLTNVDLSAGIAKSDWVCANVSGAAINVRPVPCPELAPPGGSGGH